MILFKTVLNCTLGRREVPAGVRRGAAQQRGRRPPHRTQTPAGVAAGHTWKYTRDRL